VCVRVCVCGLVGGQYLLMSADIWAGKCIKGGQMSAHAFKYAVLFEAPFIVESNHLN